MNDGGRYVRSNLKATAQGVPDPNVEVEGWLDRMDTTLVAEGPDWSEDGAYDLLALWAKLKRVRPELIARHDAYELIRAAEQILNQRGRELAELALIVPAPESWLEAVEQLEPLADRDVDPVVLNQRVEELLTELDDAELVLYAAAQQGVHDGELTARLDACRDWIIGHADLFLPASVHVQAVGMTFRPDLFEQDYDLALTALKYEVLLDALEDAEAELELDDITPLPADLAHELAERLMGTSRESATEVLPAPLPAMSPESEPSEAFSRDVLPPVGLAAALERRQPRILRWNAPDGGYFALLAVPPTETETLTLRVFVSSGEPAAELARAPVYLAGVAATLDAEAKAAFPLERLRQSNEDLRLQFGPERVLWRPAAD